MRRKYSYENYGGDESFIFVGCVKSDTTKAVCIAEKLAEQGIKLFFDVCETEKDAGPEEVAHAINRCTTALFFVSHNACESLEFRNEINYALEIRKNIICIKCDESKLMHGLDMQLANVMKLDLSGNNDSDSQEIIISKLIEYDVITQDVMGAIPVRKNTDRKKKIIFAATIVIAVILFVWGAVSIVRERVAYYNSAEWVLRNADGSEYVDASAFGEDGIAALKGMTVGELDLSGSDIENLDGIVDIDVKIVDLSDCKKLHSLKVLLDCKNLKTVKIDQDMLKYAYGLLDSDLEFEVMK